MVAASGNAPQTAKRHIAVVGAGVAGLSCARAIQARGLRVSVLERNAVIGGRLGDPLAERGGSDMGAQYLTVQSEVFVEEARRWINAGLLQAWDVQLVDLSNGQGTKVPSTSKRLVGVPAMLSIASYLARDLDVMTNAGVERIARVNGQWHLYGAAGAALGAGAFDGVVLAMPSTEALLLVGSESDFAPRLASIRWDACWSASLALARPSGIEFDGAFINDDPILSWAARESSKPGRTLGDGVAERWQLQARASWSNNFLTLAPEEAARWMQRAFAARLARPLAQQSCVATCWTQATPVDVLGEAYLWDPSRALGIAGDWCGGARIETAYLSGLGLAQAVAG